MTKKSHTLYAIISLCAILCYCGFLVKTAISDVDTVEETLPYEEHIYYYATEPFTELAVSLTVTDVPEDSTEAPTEESSEELPTMREEGFSPIYPVKGEILTAYSLRHAYNKASGDWRAHGGIDIAAEDGTEVLSIEDGAVISAYKSPIWGNVIEIDHGEYVSIYKNLAKLGIVKEGDSVSRGDVISYVGKTSALESQIESHLHFELTHYGESVDPTELLG